MFLFNMVDFLADVPQWVKSPYKIFYMKDAKNVHFA